MVAASDRGSGGEMLPVHSSGHQDKKLSLGLQTRATWQLCAAYATGKILLGLAFVSWKPFGNQVGAALVKGRQFLP